MPFEMIRIIAQAFEIVFGQTSMVLPFLILGVLALILVVLRVPSKGVVLVLLPTVTSTIAYGTTRHFNLSAASYSVVIGIWMVLGFIVAMVFISFIEK